MSAPATSPKKAKKAGAGAKKAAAASAAASHPTYEAMAKAAIAALKERNGSSR